MRRLPDWQGRLTAYVAAAAGEPFAPGRQDCALFAAGAVAAMTGEDPARAFRGRYRSLRGGLRLLRRAGWRDHVALAAGLFAPIPAAQAGPGDLAVLPGGPLPSLGVVQGEWIYAPAAPGLALAPRAAAVAAFRVPA